MTPSSSRTPRWRWWVLSSIVLVSWIIGMVLSSHYGWDFRLAVLVGAGTAGFLTLVAAVLTGLARKRPSNKARA